jgi:hypothetical protein
MSVIEKFETRERGLPQALMAAKLIEEMRAALEAAPALPLAAPVTDDEIDAAFDELGMACQSMTVAEMRRALEGFAAGRAAGVEPYAWCVAATNSADWAFAATRDGVKQNALLMDEDCIKTAPFPLYVAPQPPVPQ